MRLADQRRRQRAERLGIHPNTLRFRMKKLGVVCPESRARRQPTPSSLSV